MLKLIGINKIYKAGDMEVHALKNINLEFRESELVAVLGPSGCGKTTMLNIVGGLDKYTSGDLIINGISTKEYVDSDWDAYRNSTIGFVFQNYNLISHLTVIENVELALTLSGVSASERRARAEQALKEVGLETQFNKKPNQLSGGQMQRVAIARALVNNPDIVLADEPTGALDSVTSVQIMELLKEVAKTRLVIMVTHNGDLADRYANRIIRLLDGEIISDTNPIDSEILTENVARRPKKTSMSFITAFKLSLKNLFTKKLRTFVTAFAGSIGIIGVALILALSSGFSAYIEKMQTDTLSSFPLTITSSAFDVSNLMSMLQVPDAEEYPEAHEIYVNKVMDKLSALYQSNDITDEYVEEAIKTIDPSLTYGIVYTNGINFNIFTKQSYSGFNRITRIGSEWVQLVDNNDFINSQYDVLAGKLPTAYNELVLCVDEYNQVTDVELLQSLGILSGKDSYTFDEIMNLEFKLLTNDAVYSRVDTGEKTYFTESSVTQEEYDAGITLKIVGIVRVNQDTATGSISGTVGYHKDLQDYVLRYETENPSEIVTWQKNNPDINCFTGNLYLDEAREENPTASDNFLQKEADKARVSNLASLGAVSTPQAISIYPVDFESKELIKAHLDAYNETEGNTPVYYSDMMGLMVEAMNVLVDAISYVLIAFTSISLVVSSIMIGVIISVSVLERTKEIGILKAIGARKKDISRVFNAESLLVGFAAGALGVIITLLLSIPLNILLSSLTTINGLVALNPWHALLLVAISMLLTFIAGLVPSRSAAKKDAVVALRSE